MSAFKEFTELDLNSKSITLGVVLNIPFWYLDLYLFSKMPLNTNVQITIIAPFCLSVCWFMGNYIAGLLFLNEEKIPEENGIHRVNFFVTITSIFHLSILTLVGYIAKINFSTFIYISFSYALFRCVFWFIIGQVQDGKNKKGNTAKK